MKRIAIVFDQFNDANGVARCADAIASLLSRQNNKYDVTIIPLYRCSKESVKRVASTFKIKSIFGFYFPGFAKLLSCLPYRWLYNMIIRGEKFDIEIAFQCGIATKAISASSNENAKHLAWMHDYDVGLKLKKCYLKMDQVICVSKCNAERLARESENAFSVDYCYNPVDDKLVRRLAEEKIEIKKDRFTFVSVGRLAEEKGYERLLNCIAWLKNQGYDFSLWLIGDGYLMEKLMQQAKDLSISDMVVFVGLQSNPHKYTSKSDVFICSSWSEGYSTACTEAIMLGIPVITTNVSGAQEIIDESEAGLLTNIDDESLYCGMKHILDNQHLVLEWKQKLQTTRSRFSQKEREICLLKLIDTDLK